MVQPVEPTEEQAQAEVAEAKAEVEQPEAEVAEAEAEVEQPEKETQD